MFGEHHLFFVFFFRDSDDFSNYQMAKLMKQSKLTRKLDAVRKEINTRHTGDVSAGFAQASTASEIVTRKVVSDDRSHYILIKGLSKFDQTSTTDVEGYSNKNDAGPKASTSRANVFSDQFQPPDDIVELGAPQAEKKLAVLAIDHSLVELGSTSSDSEVEVLGTGREDPGKVQPVNLDMLPDGIRC